MSGAGPTASVVVPTRDRPDQLAECLAALDAQTVPPLEVIVVDDASADPTALDTVLAARIDRLTSIRATRTSAGGSGETVDVRVVRATGAGPAAARNLGSRVARGDLVCFTDDDCRPAPGWVGAIVERIAAGAAAVAGPMVDASPDHPWGAASQAVTNHLAEASRRGDGAPFAPSSNLGVRADVFAVVRFDESFPLAAGEDREWCDRLAAAGHVLGYETRAVVHHHQRLSAAGFWRQQVRYGRGAHHLRTRSVGGGAQGPRFYLDLVRMGFAHGPAVGTAVLLSQAGVATGLLAERLATLRP